VKRASVLRTTRISHSDAVALLAADRFNCAYYVAGYAVECARTESLHRQIEPGKTTFRRERPGRFGLTTWWACSIPPFRRPESGVQRNDGNRLRV
jgi:hypothetical protein